MTSRFDRLSKIDLMLLVTLTASISMFLFPGSTAAQTQMSTAFAVTNQKPIVFEIKNLKIPTPSDIIEMLVPDAQAPSIEIVVNVTAPPAPAITPVKTIKKSVKVSSNTPSKVTRTNRVYMHEPEIRAYICPKLGERCDIFIAVLKGENGTHECTRDNRGTNRNGSIDIGLAQINWSPRSPYTFEQLQDCKFNLDVALSMIARRGFQPWYAYTKGSYKKHLPAVLASKAITAAAVEEVIKTN